AALQTVSKTGLRTGTNRTHPAIAFLLLHMPPVCSNIYLSPSYSVDCSDFTNTKVRFVPLCIPNVPVVSITCKKVKQSFFVPAVLLLSNPVLARGLCLPDYRSVFNHLHC
ncbi:MAG: hypothetical protein ACRD2G_18755, partial [Terriglobia bacterium]